MAVPSHLKLPMAALLFVCLFPFPALADQSLGEKFRLVGRFDQPSPSSAAFAWPGSAVEIAFTGSWLDVSLRDTGKNSMVVEIDGKPSRLDLKQGEHKYRIDAPQGAHLVRLIRRTESQFGPTVFLGATTDGTFNEPRARDRSLFIIGDSISAGYGVEGKTNSCKFSADTQNQYLTYGALTARQFDADVTTAAFSGKGLVRSFDGSTKDTIPDIYLRGQPDKPGNLPFPRADVIVVHLGTNDFNNSARPSGFTERYTAFLEELRKQAPDAMIYAAIGPMLDGGDREAAVAAIKKAVEARTAAGDGKLAFVAFDDPPGQAARGCDWHPNAAGQEHMASTLSARIEADLGWKRGE